jgi:hypothetical protein
MSEGWTGGKGSQRRWYLETRRHGLKKWRYASCLKLTFDIKLSKSGDKLSDIVFKCLWQWHNLKYEPTIKHLISKTIKPIKPLVVFH